MDRHCKCGKKLKNKQKKYCSTDCQYKGYRVKKVTTVTTNCLMCDKIIETTPYKISIGKSMYCSKKCNNEHKKETYKGENNGMWGKKITEEHKKILSNVNKHVWLNTDKKEKIKKHILEYKEKNGYYPGCDEKSLEKKKQTNLKKWGVEYPGWNVLELREKLESTCLTKYGKHSWQIGQDSQNNKDTDIEVITESILIKNNINYIKQYRLYYDKTRFKKYDFYIPSNNLLIECDGDYWHGNTNKINHLNENHIKVKINDEFKNKLALDNGFNIKRFWGSEIKDAGFEDVLILHVK